MNTKYEQIFRELFEKYYDAIVYYFRQNGFPAEESKDLAQETFLRVYRGIRKYRGESKWSYLKMVAKHVMLNQIRHRESRIEDPKKRLVPWEKVPIASPADPVTGQTPNNPEKAAIREEQVQMLRQAIERLPRRMRICLSLYHQGFKYREIAVIMKTTLDSVRKCIYQARKKIERDIGRPGNIESPE